MDRVLIQKADNLEQRERRERVIVIEQRDKLAGKPVPAPRSSFRRFPGSPAEARTFT